MDTTAFLVITIMVCVGLLISLCLLYSRHKSSSGDLEAAQQQAKKLESDLEAAQQHAKKLESDLTAEQQQAKKLESDLEAAQQHAKKLESDLEAAQQQAKKLESDLEAAQQHAKKLKSNLTAAQQHAEAERQRAEGLKMDLDQARQHKAVLEKRVSLLNCKLRVLEIKPNLEGLTEKIEAIKTKKKLKKFARIAIRAALIILSGPDVFPETDGFADLGSLFSKIGDSPDDFDADKFLSENSDRFKRLIDGFDGVPDLSDQQLDSIPLENLKTYEAQLAQASQDLDAALKNFVS